MPARSLTINTVVNKLVDRVNTDTRRLRLLEQKVEILTTRADGVEQGLLAGREETKKALAELSAKLEAQTRALAELQQAMKEVIEQLKRTPTTADVKELESLLELYNPLKSAFVTREEVERLLEKRRP